MYRTNLSAENHTTMTNIRPSASAASCPARIFLDDEDASLEDPSEDLEEKGEEGYEEDGLLLIRGSSEANRSSSSRTKARRPAAVSTGVCFLRSRLFWSASCALLLAFLLAAFVVRSYRDSATSATSGTGATSSSETGSSGSGSWIEPSSLQLLDLCGPNRAEQSLEGCRKACEPAGDCCKAPLGVEGSCLSLHPEGCNVYKTHCSVLEAFDTTTSSVGGSGTSSGQRPPRGKRPAKGPGGQQKQHSSPSSPLPDDDHLTDDPASLYKLVPPAPQDILEVCSPERLSQGLDGLRGCASYCVKASCCYYYNTLPQQPSSGSSTSTRHHYSGDCRDQQPNCDAYVEPCTALHTKLQESQQP